MPSTPTEAILDVNVLIASVFADHPMHDRARRLVEGLEKFYTTPTTQGGFLRFATRPMRNDRREELTPRLTMAEAKRTLVELSEVRGHAFLPDDAPYTEIGVRSMRGHRQWTDAYLLHLAAEHGTVLATLDAKMSSLDDPANPVLFLVD